MDVTQQTEYLERAETGFARIDVGEELREKAFENLRFWLCDDRLAYARPQLEALIEAGNFDPLFDAFFQQIPFGTGGRRGPVGFGANRINAHTIGTSIQGHCEFLKKHFPNEKLSVVVAYDVRRFEDLRGVYDSERPNPLLGVTSYDFAQVAARVYAANGVRVWFNSPESEHFISTPELSFTIRQLDAHGGLNISASHNHPDDNGAKIYNARGGQEVPPLDEEMATIVESIDEATTMPWEAAVEQGLVRWIDPAVHDEYVATNVGVSLDDSLRSAKIVFTPLHGTGWSSIGQTLLGAGFDVECYADQAEPNGAFPNVPFRSPNPEVPQSCDGATAYAREKGVDAVLAADPDADRLGMVVPDPDRGWTFLNGNQVGTLLAAYMIEAGAAGSRENSFCITTVVTTSLFRRIAESRGIQCVSELPIGFKYIADVMKNIEDDGTYGNVRGSIDDFVLGIEESHGYLVTPTIRDKDAAGAAVLLGELASKLRDEGRSVLSYLDDVYRKFGYVRNQLVSTVMLGAKGYLDIRRIQASLRESPPESIGGRKVLRFVDRQDESGEFGPIVSETDRAARDLLTIDLEGDVRLVLRPSGTEPKNKIYVEAGGPALGESATDEALAQQKREIDAVANEIARAFTLEMLGRIGVEIAPWALEVSDLVPLKWKCDFADSFLPELVGKLSAGDAPGELGQWADDRLRDYGADGRMLVRDAVAAYCRDESPDDAVRSGLAGIFEL